MSKHTPGPWVAVGAMVENTHDYNPDICSCDLRAFGQDNLWREYEETLANARLIAAAPDLLSLLIQAENLLYASADKGAEPGSYGRDCFETMQAARAAIAKATGDSNG